MPAQQKKTISFRQTYGGNAVDVQIKNTSGTAPIFYILNGLLNQKVYVAASTAESLSDVNVEQITIESADADVYVEAQVISRYAQDDISQ